MKNISTETLSRDLPIYLVVDFKSNLLFDCSRLVIPLISLRYSWDPFWRKCFGKSAFWCPQTKTLKAPIDI